MTRTKVCPEDADSLVGLLDDKGIRIEHNYPSDGPQRHLYHSVKEQVMECIYLTSKSTLYIGECFSSRTKYVVVLETITSTETQSTIP